MASPGASHTPTTSEVPVPHVPYPIALLAAEVAELKATVCKIRHFAAGSSIQEVFSVCDTLLLKTLDNAPRLNDPTFAAIFKVLIDLLRANIDLCKWLQQSIPEKDWQLIRECVSSKREEAFSYFDDYTASRAMRRGFLMLGNEISRERVVVEIYTIHAAVSRFIKTS